MNIMTMMSVLPPLPTGTPDQLAQGGITFFTTWISRIGGLIAFIGAVKFALSINSEDGKEQLQAVLTMVSGFMIYSAVRNLGIFNIPATYTADAATAEFQAIMNFIGSWTRRVGALGVLIGAILFSLAIKDNNAVTKISGLKALAAGGITMSVSAILNLFVS